MLRNCALAALLVHAHAAEKAPEAPKNVATEFDVANALDPRFDGHYVADTDNDIANTFGFPVYGQVTLGSSGTFSAFIYPTRTADGTLHYVFDSDQNPKNGFFGGTPILSCDALPTSHGKGVEFFKKELNDDTKKFHWNPEISITTDDDISNPDCGATPAPTARPTTEPTKKPTAEPTAEPTKRPSMMALPKLKLGATVTPAPTPAPKRKLGAGWIVLGVVGALLFAFLVFFAITKRKDAASEEDVPAVPAA
jgi:hypothetical protein